MISVSSEIKEHSFRMHILTFHEWIHTRTDSPLCLWNSFHLLHPPAFRVHLKIKDSRPSKQLKQFSAEPISSLWYATYTILILFPLDHKEFGIGSNIKVKLKGKKKYLGLVLDNAIFI